MVPPIPIVILAAGASRRLGTPKQLVPYRGTTLLDHAIVVAQAAGCGPVLVVRGEASAIGPDCRNSDVREIANPDWATGMASSVRAGLAVVTDEIPSASAVLCTVCDQPLVTPDLLGAVAQAHREGSDLVATSYGETVGVPALFARRFFDELNALRGDEGARRVLARHADCVHAIPFPDAALDIDTPADIARLTQSECLTAPEKP